MRSACLVAPGEMVVHQIPDPVARGDLVVVKVLIAPLCSEARKRRLGEVTDEVGHEAAGIVVDCGSSRLVKEGDRVVVMPLIGCGSCWLCRAGEYVHCEVGRDVWAEGASRSGAVAEFIIKPDWLLLPVPDDISLDHAVMACCGFGPTFTALQRTDVSALHSVVVSGCGPVGLGGIAQARLRGSTVLALETDPFRSQLAKQLGAREVLDPRDPETLSRVRAVTFGRGADVGIETSGAPTAASFLVQSLRRRARMAIVAWTTEVVIGDPIRSGVSVFGCWHWNFQLYERFMWESIRRLRRQIDTMVTHRFDLDDLVAALDLMDTAMCGKVFICPFGRDNRKESA